MGANGGQRGPMGPMRDHNCSFMYLMVPCEITIVASCIYWSHARSQLLLYGFIGPMRDHNCCFMYLWVPCEITIVASCIYWSHARSQLLLHAFTRLLGFFGSLWVFWVSMAPALGSLWVSMLLGVFGSLWLLLLGLFGSLWVWANGGQCS